MLIYGGIILDLLMIIGLPILFAVKTPKNIYPKKRYAVLGIICFSVAVLSTLFVRNDFITMSILLIVYTVISQLLFRRGKTAFFYQIVYMILFFLIQMASASIGYFLIQNAYIFGAAGVQCMVLAIKFAMEIVYTLLIIQVVKVRNMDDLSKRQLSGLFLVPIFSLFNIVTMIIVGNIYYIVSGYLLLIINIIIHLCVNFYCIYLYYDISKNQEMKRQLELARQQNEIVYKYYASMEQRILNSRKVIHDIRNHLDAIEHLYTGGDTQGGSNYVKDVHVLLDSLGLKFYTSHRMLNMILNDKLVKARNMGIETKVFLHNINIGFIKDMDITTIFSNLLDNAIEAAACAEYKIIEIKSLYFNDMLTVYIKNTFQEGRKRQEDDLISDRSKRSFEGLGHMGVGLSNVAHTVKKYHGELTISRKNGLFCASVLFPCIPERSEDDTEQ